MISASGAGPRPGHRVGPYVLERQIGRGGMGAVFEGRHVETGARHAVKVLSVPASADPVKATARFRREAEVLARLASHPNLVPLHAAGLEGRFPWCSMELVVGRSLAEILDEGPLPVSEAVALIAAVARAVETIHAQGVVHRDIKPGNVIVTPDGTPRLVDFGIAFDVWSEQLTRTGECPGTPAFMAPEQLSSSSEIGPATDVYGLGGLLYAALTGHAPLEASTPAELYTRIIRDASEPPSRLRRGVPPELDDACLQALAKEPERRYPSAAAFADDLERALRGEATEARRSGGSRGRWALLAGGAVLVAAAVIGVASRGAWRPPPPKQLAAIERALGRGPLGPGDRDRLGELLVRDDLPPGLARRARVASLLDRLVEGDPASAEHLEAARTLAAAVRDGSTLERGLLRKAAAVLHRAGRHGALNVLHHGAAPVEPVALEHATAVAEAIAGGVADDDPLVRAPLDETALRALLRAPRLDAATRGRLRIRRATRRIAAGADGRDAALADLLDALADDEVAPHRGELGDAFDAWLLDRFVEANVAGDLPRTRPLADLIVLTRARALVVPVERLVTYQRMVGVANLVDIFDPVTNASEAELALEAAAVLSVAGCWSVHISTRRDLERALGDRLVAVGDAEAARPARVRNVARLAVAAVKLREVDRPRARRWALAALEADPGSVLAHVLAFRNDLEPDGWPRAKLRDRAIELDRDTPLELRDLESLAYGLPGDDPVEKSDRVLETLALLEEATPRLHAIVAAGGRAPWVHAPERRIAWILSRQILAIHESNLPCCLPGALDGAALVRGLVEVTSRPGFFIEEMTTTRPHEERIYPQTVQALVARHHERHGRFDAALAIVDEVLADLEGASRGGSLDVRRDFHDAHVQRARILDRLGRSEEAAAARAIAAALGVSDDEGD